jgi:hypothetical protein
MSLQQIRRPLRGPSSSRGGLRGFRRGRLHPLGAGVFTRIRSGAAAVASYGGALGSKLYSAAAARTSESWLDLLGMIAAALGEKP